MLILLAILTAWTAIFAGASFGIASALSRRIRDINFPRDMDGPGDRSKPGRRVKSFRRAVVRLASRFCFTSPRT